MIKVAPRYTAAQVILLAADDLMAQGASEFSEWELTLATWNRERNRFGLRGFAQAHPDHKRVMMEIMGRKPQNPILLGLMEKMRPNYYRLTPLGRAEAVRLRHGDEKGTKKKPSAMDQYDVIVGYLAHKAFTKWREDPDEPRHWADVADFLGAPANDKEEAVKRMQQVSGTIRAAIDWCLQKNIDYLPATNPRQKPSIHMRDLADLPQFLQALKYRFPQIDGGGDKKRPPKKG